jgi:hypothetical protein
MDLSAQPNRRLAPRRRVFKGAKISFWGLRATIDCVVRDISETGARLSVESSVGIPETFHLSFDGAPMRSCRLVWRKASQIGVTFVASAPSTGSTRL